MASTSRLRPSLLFLGAVAGTTYCASTLRADEAAIPNHVIESKPADWASRSQLQDRTRKTYFWGSNKHNVVAPSNPETEMIKRPKEMVFFESQPLRHLALHEKYAVAVDAHGDVLQWGEGHQAGSSTEPRKTLCGRNIVQVATTDDKIYALSKSGKVYVYASSFDKQAIDTNERKSLRSWWRVRWLFAQDPGVDVAEVKPNVKLASAEKIEALSAGLSHLLARTSSGRAFCTPVDSTANAWGQLGTRAVEIGGEQQMLHPMGFEPAELGAPASEALDIEVRKPKGLGGSASIPKSWVTSVPAPEEVKKPVLKPTEDLRFDNKDIRFSTTLHEIPALKGLNVVQFIAGDRHSLARTSEGRILSFGANNYGSLGVGPSLAFPIIPTPTEVTLTRSYPKDVRVSCKSIAAGGNTSYFVAETTDLKIGRKGIDVLAAGMGSWGGIGNGQWNHQGSPTKVKTISGLLEWDEKAQAVLPIPIHDLSIGRSHAVAVLDNAVTIDQAKYGRDVFVFGLNESYQLGNGKRSNSAIPQHLHPLSGGPVMPEDAQQWKISSRMPHNRLQLHPALPVGGHLAEETIVAGANCTAVYWKIVD